MKEREEKQKKILKINLIIAITDLGVGSHKILQLFLALSIGIRHDF